MALIRIEANSQDAQIFSLRDYDISGTVYNLSIGQTITISTQLNGGPSIKIFNQSAGVKVKLIPTIGNYPEISYYTETNISSVGGTDQYNCNPVIEPCRLLEISCVDRFLPEPKIFIPIDRNNVHPDNGETAPEPVGNKRMLMLRKAYFRENSEDIDGIHGPYAEIKANICRPIVMQYSYENFESSDDWKTNGNRYATYDIPGYGWDADIWPEPSPRNEWIDNWWGCYYSNMALLDWDLIEGNSVALVISEADATNPEDVLGRAEIRKNMEGCILIKCRMFGWVVVQNVDIGPSGREPSVNVATTYLYNNWNGVKPEDFYGPGFSIGTQYEPFGNIADVEDMVPRGVSTGVYSNNIVGVLGNGVISAPNTLSVDMTYVPAAPTSCETFTYAFNWDDRLTTLYYRSRKSGIWNDVETWETSPVSNFSSGVKSPAIAIPTSTNSFAVKIRNTHAVHVTENIKSKPITIEQSGRLYVPQSINVDIVP